MTWSKDLFGSIRFNLDEAAGTATLSRRDVNRPRILSVDDSLMMLHMVNSALHEDYEMFLMEDPKLVENFLRFNTPDLILLDCTMPDINGLELIKIIRGMEQHQNTPIVILSSLSGSRHIDEATSAGACDYVVKPFDAGILKKTVAYHIAKKTTYLKKAS